MPKNNKLAATLAAAKAGVRKRDVIDVREPRAPKLPIQEPTPEQMRHADYAETEICDKGANGVEIKLGRAYRRVPLFETMAKAGQGIDDTALAALRFYRKAHEAQDASPTRCALNMEGRGGGHPLCLPFGIAGMMLDDLHGGTVVDALERGVGAALLPTLRAVALDDRTFSALAIERFGGRKVPWIDQQKERGTDRQGNRLAYVDKVAPRSGAHRTIIAGEFAAALVALVAAHAPYAGTMARPALPRLAASTPPSEAEAELARLVTTPSPAVDPEYLDGAGFLRPFAEIADIIRARADAAPVEV